MSQATNIPVDKIKQNNALYSDTISAGQVLLIPEMYTVKPGDTLFYISQCFGISLDELKRLNGFYSDNLWPGQVIYVPQGSPYQQITVSWEILFTRFLSGMEYQSGFKDD